MADGIYTPRVILKALSIERDYYKSLGLEGKDEQAPNLVFFKIENETIIDVIYIPRKEFKNYVPEENVYYLDMTRDSGIDIIDYNLEPVSKLYDLWFPQAEKEMNEDIKTEYAIINFLKKYGFATQEDLYNNIGAQVFVIDNAVKELLKQDKIKFEDGQGQDGINGWKLTEQIEEDLATLEKKMDKTEQEQEQAKVENLISNKDRVYNETLCTRINRLISEALNESIFRAPTLEQFLDICNKANIQIDLEETDNKVNNVDYPIDGIDIYTVDYETCIIDSYSYEQLLNKLVDTVKLGLGDYIGDSIDKEYLLKSMREEQACIDEVIDKLNENRSDYNRIYKFEYITEVQGEQTKYVVIKMIDL